MLKAGIVGLPNVGKSTLFNALVRARKAAAENYPFCTVEPNLGVVGVPDPRLESLARFAKVSTMIQTTVEFVDIAGLVQGASRGEGLGNKFLSHIREVDAVVQVVRCFEDPDIHHVTGRVDPRRDIEIVTLELILADVEAVQKKRERIGKEVKQGDKHALLESLLLDKIEPHLKAGQPALTLALSKEEREMARHFFLLTDRPTTLVANIKEADLAQDANLLVEQVREYGKTHLGCETVMIAAQLESDLIDLPLDEAAQYRQELGVSESGLSALIRSTYHLLDLRTFFTFNEKEVRAWTIPAGGTALKAAGLIHSDIERGFIKAETISWQNLVKAGSIPRARDDGHYRIEGKDYVVQDGDVLLFKFHV